MPEPLILRNAPLPPIKIMVSQGGWLALAYAVAPSSEVSAPRFPAL